VADDNVITPPWKRNLRTTTSESARKGARTKAFAELFKQGIYDTYDKLGAEAWLLQFAQRSGENEREFFKALVARILPLEIQGGVDHTLTVKIVKQVGEREIVIDAREHGFKKPPRDAVTGERLPVATLPGSAPTVDPVDG